MNPSRVSTPSIQGNSTNYDPIFGYESSQPIEFIPSEERGLIILQPPHMILNQTHLDYTKYCTVPFGAYVQANHETVKTKSNVTRTLDAIYLRPAQNQQGGHELMDLSIVVN
jgi:hypothetical protein